MNIVFITRSSLYTCPGGDTLQVIHTARQLGLLGIGVDIKLTNEPVEYHRYDLMHFFNIIRPADILYHIGRSNKPFAVSPNLVSYQEFDRRHRTGPAAALFRYLSGDSIEYCKTIARWLRGGDTLRSLSYLWKGQQRSIQQILQKASVVFPSSQMEYEQLAQLHTMLPGHRIVPNGIDPVVFSGSDETGKDPMLVLCVARIEGLKNQLNLIRALNHTAYRLTIIGNPAPHQMAYYQACRKEAAGNISFINHLPQQELAAWYGKANIHILPSWFETCGLSTLEAAAMGCRIVVGSRGYVREYYGQHALYCDPGSPQHIRQCIEKAHAQPWTDALKQKVMQQFTWQQAARQIMEGYKNALNN
jgi:Glycosyltransferase